jgi:hypothetical protein
MVEWRDTIYIFCTACIRRERRVSRILKTLKIQAPVTLIHSPSFLYTASFIPFPLSEQSFTLRIRRASRNKPGTDSQNVLAFRVINKVIFIFIMA